MHLALLAGKVSKGNLYTVRTVLLEAFLGTPLLSLSCIFFFLLAVFVRKFTKKCCFLISGSALQFQPLFCQRTASYLLFEACRVPTAEKQFQPPFFVALTQIYGSEVHLRERKFATLYPRTLEQQQQLLNINAAILLIEDHHIPVLIPKTQT